MKGFDRLMITYANIATGQKSIILKRSRKMGEFPETKTDLSIKLYAHITFLMRFILNMISEKTYLNRTQLNCWMTMVKKYSIFLTNNTGIIFETKIADFIQLILGLFVPLYTTKRITQFSYVSC